MNCSQVCPYNTLKGCKVFELKGICPMANVRNVRKELFENPEQLVKTKDVLFRGKKKYEVVIADDNIFVVCPIIYSKKEESDIVKYSEAEIYAGGKLQLLGVCDGLEVHVPRRLLGRGDLLRGGISARLGPSGA